MSSGLTGAPAVNDAAPADDAPGADEARGWRRQLSGALFVSRAERLQRLDAALRDDPAAAHYVLRGELWLEQGESALARADFDAALKITAKFDPAKSWGVVEQVLRDRALQGLQRLGQRGRG